MPRKKKEKLIITNGIEQEFKKLVKKGVSPEVTENVKKVIEGKVVTAQSVTRTLEPFYIPFIQRTSLEIPTDRKMLNKFKRYFFYNEPIVGAACELHAEFPLSTFGVTHEDSVLAKEFEDIVEYLNLFEFLLAMLLEYWVIGESFVFGFFDDGEDPRYWKKLIMLNPDYVDVQTAYYSKEIQSKIYLLEPDEVVKRIVNNGPEHPETKELYTKLPSGIIEAAKTGKKIKLPYFQVYHFKREGDYFSQRGVSIIERCFKWLMYRDKLREAQYAIADRHTTPKEFYLIGSDTHPATQEMIDSFRELLISMYNQPNQAIVWHHNLRIQWEGASGRSLPIVPELQYVDKQLAIALLINEGIITAERQPYASTSVALDVMIQRYLTLRSRVEEFLKKFVFGTICKLNGIVKRTQTEIRYKIRFDHPMEDLWLPDIKWTKGSLRDDLSRLQFILSLVDKDLLPPDYIYNLLDFTKEEVMTKLEEWHKWLAERERGVSPGGSSGPGGVSGPLLPEMPPEYSPIGEELGESLGEEVGPGEELPELVEEESRAVPPEAHEEMGLPTGF